MIKQISVFLENKPGTLAEFARLMQKKEIDLRALSLAETESFGIARLITDDAMGTINALKDEGYIAALTNVVAVEVEDKPGALVKILDALGDNGINLEYTYAFLAKKKDSAFLVLRVMDDAAAERVLKENGIRPLTQDDLPSLFGQA